MDNPQEGSVLTSKDSSTVILVAVCCKWIYGTQKQWNWVFPVPYSSRKKSISDWHDKCQLLENYILYSLRRGCEMKSLDTARICSLLAWAAFSFVAILKRSLLGSQLNKIWNCAAFSPEKWRMDWLSMAFHVPSRDPITR